MVTEVILSDQLGQPRENKDALPRHIQLTLGEYCGSNMVVPTSHSVFNDWLLCIEIEMTIPGQSDSIPLQATSSYYESKITLLCAW